MLLLRCVELQVWKVQDMHHVSLIYDQIKEKSWLAMTVCWLSRGLRFRDNGNEHGDYCSILGLYRDNGEENGNHYLVGLQCVAL